MNRPPLRAVAAAAFALSFGPLVVIFGVIDLPSLGEIRASKTADILGVWVMTWGLILLGVAASFVVSWLAWTSETATQALEASATSDESLATPDVSERRSIA
jgi:hypothetical protein